jgi:hypothetical protein
MPKLFENTLENEAYIVNELPSEGTRLIYIIMKPQDSINKARMKTLVDILRLACTKSADVACDVLMDCSGLKCGEMVKQFIAMGFKDFLDLGRETLRKFVLISPPNGGSFRTLATGIIKLKKASDYTHICATLLDAYRVLGISK